MLKTASKQYKFVLVGDSAVGKSSLLNRFVDKVYSESFLSTIGVDFKFKRVKIDNIEIKLQIWDTAGQETFRSIVSAYYTSADAIVIVYDITSYDSFQNIKNYWIEEAENNNKNNAKIFLIGNKIDEQSRREVQKFTIETFMQQHAIQNSYEASAKIGQNVQETFTDIARNLYYGVKQKPIASKVFQSNNKNQQNISSNPLENKLNRISLHQDTQPKENQKQEDQYEQVISVDNDTRQQKQQKKQKQERIKISQNLKSKSKPKNPNYNKNCCLK